MAENTRDRDRGRDKDDDKDEKSEKEPVIHPGIFFELVAIVVVLFILSRILIAFNNGDGSAGGGFSSFPAFFEYLGVGSLFAGTVSVYIFFATVLSGLCIMGIVYILLQLYVLEKALKQSLYPEGHTTAPGKKEKNTRWERAVAHISSDNPSDWRLAILECDIILDEMLDEEGFRGGTIGDKLKSADPGEFHTLNNAWEAHKIRNAIAHEGHDFTLTQREARRIVALYETVFQEFDFIDIPQAPPQRGTY